MSTRDHALSDIKILDLTRAVAGPACTRMLAEMGAEVIKIEAAPNGDMTRAISVFRDQRSLYFVQQNRGKQSVCIDLKDPRGIALLDVYYAYHEASVHVYSGSGGEVSPTRQVGCRYA